MCGRQQQRRGRTLLFKRRPGLGPSVRRVCRVSSSVLPSLSAKSYYFEPNERTALRSQKKKKTTKDVYVVGKY